MERLKHPDMGLRGFNDKEKEKILIGWQQQNRDPAPKPIISISIIVVITKDILKTSERS